MNYISAQFRLKDAVDKSDPASYGGRSYTYQTDIGDLTVGELIKVEGRDGPQTVCVDAVGLPTPSYACKNVIERVSKKAAEKPTEDAEGLPDGIYLFISHEDYLKIDRISNSYLQAMHVSPADAWKGSSKNPDRATDNKAKTPQQQANFDLGSAYHVGMLELQSLHDRYARQPDQTDEKYDTTMNGNKALLRNGTAIGEALATLNQAKKKAGETVMEQAERLMGLGYQGYIWPMEVAEFERNLGKRTAIKANRWDNLMRDLERVSKIPELAQYLEGGVSEITILWTDSKGRKCKARLDKLHPELIVDLKSFDNSRRKVLEQCVHDAIRYDRLYIQAVFYFYAVKAIMEHDLLVMDARLEGAREFDIVRTKSAQHVIDTIKRNAVTLDFAFVFQQKAGVPNVLVRNMRLLRCDEALYGDGMTDPVERRRISDAKGFFSALYMMGETAINHALKQHDLYSEVYEDGEPWQYLNVVADVDESLFNKYWLGGE